MGESGAQGLHLPVNQPMMDMDTALTKKEESTYSRYQCYFTSYCRNPESTVGMEGIVPTYFRSSEKFRHLVPIKISEV